MKFKYLFCLMLPFLLGGCVKEDFDDIKKAQEDNNAAQVFGVQFDPEQDWCTTMSGNLAITNIPSSITKVQILVYVAEEDGETSLYSLNESDVDGNSTINMVYDAPIDNLGLYVAFVSNDDFVVVKVEGDTVVYGSAAGTRAIDSKYPIPVNVVPTIGSISESFASQRGWVTGEKLYSLTNYGEQKMNTGDYSDAFKTTFRTVIFSYFKNGRAYDNLPLIKNSGIYNENAYPFTTGDEPIIVTPVYKRDGAGKYGNEVYNSDLYYYYYKDGTNVDLATLPKYKALSFADNYGTNDDDNIGKRGSYTLIYWGDGEPSVGTTGSYQFPAGYKIGFMIQAKTEYEAPKKQGEVYADGRLNGKINNWPNFKSSNLSASDPRAAYLKLGGRMLLCFESGTDRDFNDVILDIEGGVEPIGIIPEIEENTYTFCFEDTPVGDYDLNDIVIKATRSNKTSVTYTVIACGAHDNLYIKNINGNRINDKIEVHKLFNCSNEYYNATENKWKIFVNTESKNFETITETISVKESFSFLNYDLLPYIYDETTGVTVKLATKGQNPHGIMIPNDFKYPRERVCIKDAYNVEGHKFNSWGQNKITDTDWYKFPVEELVF